MSYVVCARCGGDRDTPQTVVLGPFIRGSLCVGGFHNGSEPGYEVKSPGERARIDERRERERERLSAAEGG